MVLIRKCEHYYAAMVNNDDSKPLCVFGVADNEAGREIEKEMLEWLVPNYNVIEVVHDGTLFEYPALHFMQELCIKTGKPCLYIHTRGAYHRWNTTKPTRRMWRDEFVNHKNWYFKTVNYVYPTVSCPSTGTTKIPLYNGFVTNAAAMVAIPEFKPSEDRMVFEQMFTNTKVHVIGRIYINDTDFKMFRKYVLTKYKE